MWLQETGDWRIVPDIVMNSELDRLGGISLGAINHHRLFQESHTIAIWWPKQRFAKPIHHLLQEITGVSRPGSIRGAVIWTTNPDHKVTVEDPLTVDECKTVDVLADIHMLHYLTEFEIPWNEYLILRMNKPALLEDSLNPHIARYLNSLKKADVYRLYSKEIK